MALPDWVVSNFETIKRAFSEESVALLECTDSKTGGMVPVLCAVQHCEDGEIELKPFARMFTSDPNEEVESPFESDSQEE